MKKEPYHEKLAAAKDMLVVSGVMDAGLDHLKKVIAPGAPFAVLELMDNKEKLEELINSVADIYADSPFTIAELEQIKLFQSGDIGKKLAKFNIVSQSKIVEVTQEWVYGIIEEVREKDAQAHKEKTSADVSPPEAD